ncbi:MAG: hypothetical protein WD894_08710 [Pirellulales bacterium]
MKRMWTAIALMLLAVTALSAGEGRRTILIDNFNDGDSEGWEEFDITCLTGPCRGSFDAGSGEYVLETTEAIPVNEPTVGKLDADWAPAEDNPVFGHGTMRGTIRANTDGTTVGFALRENHEDRIHYGFFGSTSFGTFYIERFSFFDPDARGQTILAMADPDDFPFEAGKTYILEASIVGDKLTLKAWEEGARKPRRPILKVHHDEFAPEDGTGLAVVAFFDPEPLTDGEDNNDLTEVTVSATVDDLTFTARRGKHEDNDDEDDEDDD